MKNQSECVKVKVCLFKMERCQIMKVCQMLCRCQMKIFSKSNEYESDQNIFEFWASDSHRDTCHSLDDSWKLQSSSKNKKTCSYTNESNAYIIADFSDYWHSNLLFVCGVIYYQKEFLKKMC